MSGRAHPHAPTESPGERRDRIARLFASVEVVLSPMAGVTDRVFRAICAQHGAQVTYCEFVSADGVLHGNTATFDLMELGPDEHPVGIQLFGGEPDTLAAAARTAQGVGPDLIDLNFGCPVKKVVKRNGGSALLCDVPRMDRIVRAVVDAVELPVTAKIRIGWSRSSLNYLEVTRMLEEAGACAITVHGRTRDQLFSGVADWGPIAEIKAIAQVPIIGNGDVWSADDYSRIKRETNCDAVMIARGSIGNPWIFDEIQARVRGIDWQRPHIEEVVDTIVDHLDREIGLKGPHTGMMRMRRHFTSYLKGYPGVAQLRKRIFACEDRDRVVSHLMEYRDGVRGAA